MSVNNIMNEYIIVYLYYTKLHRYKNEGQTVAQQHRGILKYDIQQKSSDTEKDILYNYILYDWYDFVWVCRKATHCFRRMQN